MKILKGLLWLILALTVGLSPIWTILMGFVFIVSLFANFTLFGLSVAATQMLLGLACLILYGISGIVYGRRVPREIEAPVPENKEV